MQERRGRTTHHCMTEVLDPCRVRHRRLSVQATATTLVLAAALWTCFATIVTDPERRQGLVAGVAYVVAGTILGPLAAFFAHYGAHSVSLAMGCTTIAAWSGWFVLLLRTRIGDAHWKWHLLGSLAWCLIGLWIVNAARTVH